MLEHAGRRAMKVERNHGLIVVVAKDYLLGAVESIFSWPGLGRLTVQAINSRDYPLVQGCILMIALTYVLVNLLTDLAYGFLDPRIKYE